MKIAILGTRGIPNHHGGFEQFAEYFSVFLQKHGHEVCVYNSSLHPYKEQCFKGVQLIHCNDPEDKIGTAGQFIYDLNCILDSRKRKFDVILQLGYTSSTVWYFLMPKKAVVITNMDGLEWKRSKYSGVVQKFLKFAEKLGANNSDFLISDSKGIQEYLKKTYQKKSEYIAYGAELFSDPDEKHLTEYSLLPYSYHLVIARMEPENNVEVVIKGIIESDSNKPLILIGNYLGTAFGKYLYKNYGDDPRIQFIGAVYDIDKLNNLRYFSDLYFHGHSVGGTNPSLLEAMASDCLIIANDNIFNRSILGEDAFYFSDCKDIAILSSDVSKERYQYKICNNREKITKQYTWDRINTQYLNFIEQCLNSRKI